MHGTRICRYAGLLVLLIATGGCGGEGPVSFRGVVKLDGRPLEGATVHFIAQEDGGRDAFGSTDAEGEFELSTLEPGDGAFRGNYKVIVRPATQANPELSAESPTEAMAAASAGQRLNRPAVALPPRYSQPSQTILMQRVPADGNVVFEVTSM